MATLEERLDALERSVELMAALLYDVAEKDGLGLRALQIALETKGKVTDEEVGTAFLALREPIIRELTHGNDPRYEQLRQLRRFVLSRVSAPDIADEEEERASGSAGQSRIQPSSLPGDLETWRARVGGKARTQRFLMWWESASRCQRCGLKIYEFENHVHIHKTWGRWRVAHQECMGIKTDYRGVKESGFLCQGQLCSTTRK